MKAVRASQLRFGIVLVTASLGASDLLAQALPDTVKAAQRKLGHDAVSLSIFRYLGKVHCVDGLTARKPESLPSEYGILYNQLYPLPRLISEKALRAAYSSIEKGLAGVGGYAAKSSSKFLDPFSVCTRLYETGAASTKAFRALVSDPESLHSSEDVDLNQHMQDYLNGYFIKPSG